MNKKVFPWKGMLVWCMLMFCIMAACFDLFHENIVSMYLIAALCFCAQLLLIWWMRDDLRFVTVCGFLYSSLFCIYSWEIGSFLLKSKDNYASSLDYWVIILEALGFLFSSYMLFSKGGERRQEANKEPFVSGKDTIYIKSICISIWIELMAVMHGILLVTERTSIETCFAMVLLLFSLVPQLISKRFLLGCSRAIRRFHAAISVVLCILLLKHYLTYRTSEKMILWCLCLDVIGWLLAIKMTESFNEKKDLRILILRRTILSMLSVLLLGALWLDLFSVRVIDLEDPFIVGGLWMIAVAASASIIGSIEVGSRKWSIIFGGILLMLSIAYYPIRIFTRGFPVYAREQVIREYHLDNTRIVLSDYYALHSFIEDSNGSVDLKEIENAVHHRYIEMMEATNTTELGEERKLLFIYEYKTLTPLKNIHIVLLDKDYQFSEVATEEVIEEGSNSIAQYPVQGILR